MEETVKRQHRIMLMHQQPAVIWLTGLSGAGKTTIALELEKRLVEKGFKTYLLDGDLVRSGLSKDLGFTQSDRRENIRRIGEVCKLMNDAGLIVISAFISPFRSERDFVRALIPRSEFSEVYISASLEVCEQRDVKGLYKKARTGLIPDFTGIDSEYEPPLKPEVVLQTDRESVNESVNKLLEYILPRVSQAL